MEQVERHWEKVVIIRVFIAVEFPEVLKGYLRQAQEIVKKNSIKGNFTLKDNLHLTLKFIGEVEYAQIGRLKAAIENTVKDKPPFSLTLDSIGKFSRNNKIIPWVGLKESTELFNLYKELDFNLAQAGYPQEKRSFSPHITLGREVILKEDFSQVKREIEIEPKEIRVDKLSLMESTRIKGILTYRPLHIYHFLN